MPGIVDYNALPREARGRRRMLEALTSEQRREEIAFQTEEIRRNAERYAVLEQERTRLAGDTARLSRLTQEEQQIAWAVSLAANRRNTMRALEHPVAHPVSSSDSRAISAAQRRLRETPNTGENAEYRAYLTRRVEQIRAGERGSGAPQGDAVLSPQMVQALGVTARQYERMQTGANGYLDLTGRSHGIHDDPAAVPGLVGFFDSREIGHEIAVPEEDIPEGLRVLMGEVQLQHVGFRTVPEREEYISEFYDRVDTFDPRRLDLSCLEGTDGGTRGPDGLTPSERDTLELMTQVRMNQAAGNYFVRNQGSYLTGVRYTDPALRAETKAKIACVSSLSSGLMLQLGLTNGYQSTFGEHNWGVNRDMEPEIRAMAASSILQRYTMELANIRDERIPPLTMKLTNVLGDGGASVTDVLLPGGASGPDTQGLTSSLWMAAVEQPLYMTAESGDYMMKHNLQAFDMIYLDGKPAREALLERFPDSQFPSNMRPERIAAERELLMKGELLRIMATGSGRVEAAVPMLTKNDTVELTVVPLRADAKYLHSEYAKRDHSALRRLFDWGLTKIKTPVDTAGEIWKQDPDAADRVTRILLHARSAAFFGQAANTERDLSRQEHQAGMGMQREADAELDPNAPTTTTEVSAPRITTPAHPLARDFLRVMGDAAGVMRVGKTPEERQGAANLVVALCDIVEGYPRMKGILSAAMPRGEISFRDIRNAAEHGADRELGKLPLPEGTRRLFQDGLTKLEQGGHTELAGRARELARQAQMHAPRPEKSGPSKTV